MAGDGAPRDLDVVEPEHKAANYAKQREEQRDTTDDSWGKGVFADKEQEAPPVAAKKEAPPDEIPDLRLRNTEPASLEEPDDDDDDDINPLMLVGAVVVGTAVMFGLMYGGLTIAGVI